MRDLQHALEIRRPAPDVDYCTRYNCSRRAHVVIDGSALCVAHSTQEFTDNLHIYMGPGGVVASDARF